jgi:hypothetical protein
MSVASFMVINLCNIKREMKVSKKIFNHNMGKKLLT